MKQGILDPRDVSRQKAFISCRASCNHGSSERTGRRRESVKGTGGKGGDVGNVGKWRIALKPADTVHWSLDGNFPSHAGQQRLPDRNALSLAARLR
jgi:hypothetical protein